ncbi:TIGR04563 family protein [Myxococcus sp. CA051A]|uniref:TIGR04563 family protein n=1 Tax=Myxococcus llanfairpwllgwyngyllgogerychwyrndrobwllllantysiliogogogochensis TaxID=2590453 RepID=A0A540WRI5_9BACT|nr:MULTISPECIES: TIGR04563 family protein [Myxococcus]NTX14505.1 TIGR04563 family protein [Myxococcus sp. CA056]NTX41089.1 TIGR04563 family protein [Myxococcus sp. CA033]NTX53804.1 TIGR04563 family protein [Myxococcus sp. CA039A]NTX64253.1 TIGR04563 family protein [Myxococcus sp. CA051A]TQF11619.1 TIGR04563 family protein [Myxococcus llanfairpwllgwyngyllgogerychwyrndrobwllllantysiliogogogochensis]
MATTDHRKQSLYFPEDMLEEIQREATRQDRSLSWIVQQAWKVARAEIRRMPSVNDVLSSPPPPRPAPVVASPAAAAPATPPSMVAAAPNPDEPKS